MARNHAAHFARTEEDVDGSIESNRRSRKRKAEACEQKREEDNEWCGPFAVARRLLKNRSKAKQEREEQIRSATIYIRFNILRTIRVMVKYVFCSHVILCA